MPLEEDTPPRVPEWFVTYSDMMSLLLTFFILLVSMSEIKKNDRFQGVADSIQEHFGYDASPRGLVPGDSRPRNSALASLALAGRSLRQMLIGGQASAKAGSQPPGSLVSAMLKFDDSEIELSEANCVDLRAAGELLRGRAQKIEVRGHALQNAPDNWDLAFQRARQTMQFLVTDLSLEPERIRISVTPQQVKDHAQVEVILDAE